MEDLYLVYIHQVGRDYKDKNFYEFLFAETTENIDGVEWESYPASGNPQPPKEELIKQVGKVGCELDIIVVQNNELFSMWDAVDGVVALGWESIDGLDDYPDPRITFPFGMKLKEVESLLYARDITIKYKKKVSNE